jgi:hypothetical protein
MNTAKLLRFVNNHMVCWYQSCEYSLVITIVTCYQLFISDMQQSCNNHMENIVPIFLHVKIPHCGKFVSLSQDLSHTVLMLSIYLLLNFQNLGCAISKLSTHKNTTCNLILVSIYQHLSVELLAQNHPDVLCLSPSPYCIKLIQTITTKQAREITEVVPAFNDCTPRTN